MRTRDMMKGGCWPWLPECTFLLHALPLRYCNNPGFKTVLTSGASGRSVRGGMMRQRESRFSNRTPFLPPLGHFVKQPALSRSVMTVLAL